MSALSQLRHYGSRKGTARRCRGRSLTREAITESSEPAPSPVTVAGCVSVLPDGHVEAGESPAQSRYCDIVSGGGARLECPVDPSNRDAGIPGRVAHSASRSLTNRQMRSEEHTSELQSRGQLVCQL